MEKSTFFFSHLLPTKHLLGVPETRQQALEREIPPVGAWCRVCDQCGRYSQL